MNAFTRFCLAIYRPVLLGQYVLIILQLVASGATKAWMRQWRWPIIGVMAAGLVVQIVATIARKKQQREASNIGQGSFAERLPH
jgi:hypothetical protein